MVTSSRERHFVVTVSALELHEILEQLAPGDTSALHQGRVFVNGQRATPSLGPVSVGSRVTWVAERTADGRADLEFEIVDRHEGLFVVKKPAAWSSEPDRAGQSMSLRDHLSAHLGERDVHIATRLDSGVSGLVLAAVGAKACRLVAQLQERERIQKHYLAMAVGEFAGDVEWSQPVDSREALSRCHPLSCSTKARFSGSESPVSIVRVEAITGRRHQIRIHFANNGHPLLGDRRYGGHTRYVLPEGAVRPISRPMLHSWQLAIHLRGRIWSTSCDAPLDMRLLWRDLSGDDTWPMA